MTKETKKKEERNKRRKAQKKPEQGKREKRNNRVLWEHDPLRTKWALKSSQLRIKKPSNTILKIQKIEIPNRNLSW